MFVHSSPVLFKNINKQSPMDSLFNTQIDFILKRGHGIKACLFDQESKHIINNLIPLSTLQENGFFYFDFLSNRERMLIKDMCCVVILRPSALKSLLEELVSPCYCSYIVLFTSQIDPFALEIMANSDIHSVITEVHEINMELCRQDHSLFTICSGEDPGSSASPQMHYKRTLDGIMSSLYSLQISPAILYFPDNFAKNNEEQGTKGLCELARDILARTKLTNFKSEGTLVLLKRNFDLITPLVYDWHYQAMINEHFTLDGMVIKAPGRSQGSIFLSDFFFAANRFRKIAEVGDEINQLVKSIETVTGATVSLQREFDGSKATAIEKITKRLSKKAVAETHLSIYNKIIDEAVKLDEEAETMHRILRTRDFDLKSSISEVLNGSIFESSKGHAEVLETCRFDSTCDDKGRDMRISSSTVLACCLKNGLFWKGSLPLQFHKHADFLSSFCKKWNPCPCLYKYSLNSNVDSKLSYVSPLKKILKHLITGKLKEGFLVNVKESATAGPIVIYIQGGVTMREYREAMEISSDYGTEIILIGTKILTRKEFLSNEGYF